MASPIICCLLLVYRNATTISLAAHFRKNMTDVQFIQTALQRIWSWMYRCSVYKSHELVSLPSVGAFFFTPVNLHCAEIAANIHYERANCNEMTCGHKAKTPLKSISMQNDGINEIERELHVNYNAPRFIGRQIWNGMHRLEKYSFSLDIQQASPSAHAF